MRMDDFTNLQQLSESPLGFLKKIGLGAASALGSKSAAYKIEIGKRANFLKRKYKSYLESTEQEATSESLINFLNSVGYPTESAEKVVGFTADQEPQPVAQEPQPTTKKPVAQEPQPTTKKPVAKKPVAKKPQPAAKRELSMTPNAIRKREARARAKQAAQEPQPTTKKPVRKRAQSIKSESSIPTSKHLLSAAQKILTLTEAKNNNNEIISNQTVNTVSERFLSKDTFISISNMLQEHNFYWSDLGYGLRIDESVSNGVFIQQLTESALTDKQIDQALSAAVDDASESELTDNQIDQALVVAVNDAFDKGMLKFDNRGNVAVNKNTNSPTAQSVNPQVNQSNLDKIKQLVNGLTPSEKIELKNLLN